jgi:hypothetical protein
VVNVVDYDALLTRLEYVRRNVDRLAMFCEPRNLNDRKLAKEMQQEAAREISEIRDIIGDAKNGKHV